jgi:hypothetical protein
MNVLIILKDVSVFMFPPLSSEFVFHK